MKKALSIQCIALLAALAPYVQPTMADNNKTIAVKPESKTEIKLQQINRKQIHAKLGKVILVDALDKKYFDRSRIKGSINIPYDDSPQLIPQLLPNKEAEIVVYCMDSM